MLSDRRTDYSPIHAIEVTTKNMSIEERRNW